MKVEVEAVMSGENQKQEGGEAKIKRWSAGRG